MTLVVVTTYVLVFHLSEQRKWTTNKHKHKEKVMNDKPKTLKNAKYICYPQIDVI